MTTHCEYVFETASPLDRGQADQVCRAVLNLLRPHIGLIEIDAYTDDDELSDPARQAQAWLRGTGSARGRGDPGMGIRLDPSDEQHWQALRDYAARSIHVQLWGGRRERELGTLHDCASSVVVALTDPELTHLADTLGDLGSWVSLAQLRAAHRRARRAKWTARRRRWTSLFSPPWTRRDHQLARETTGPQDSSPRDH